MKYTILSGSSRKNSATLRVAKGLERILLEKGINDITLIDFEAYDIPFFNGGDILREALTPFQQKVVQGMSEADSIIFLTPEYNWFPSAEMINLIHRLGDNGFEDLWSEKVFSFIGISSGRGGRIPTVQLSYVVGKLINVFGFESVINSKNFEVQFAKKVLDENGASLGNEEFDKGYRAFADYLIRLSERWATP